MSAMKFCEKAVILAATGVMCASLFSMIVVGMVQIILRNFFDSGFQWADVFMRSMVLWTGFSGAVVVTSKGGHISIGILSKIMPRALIRPAHAFVSAFAAIVCAFLTYASAKFVIAERAAGSALFGGVPLWISELIIPATFLSLTFLFLAKAGYAKI